MEVGVSAQPPAVVSPRLSFRGWLLGVWFAKNKDFVKTVLSPCSAFVAAGAVIDTNTLRLALATLGVGLTTIGFKLGLDSLDFFFSNVVVEPKP